MANPATEEKITPAQVENAHAIDYNVLNNASLDDKLLNEEARQGTVSEHSLSLWQALKTYKKAAFWSIRKHSPRHLHFLLHHGLW
jgi:MFS transporter, SP family, general alpha glucoside:H+ symporter